jgi:hypothetical protein
VILLLFLLLSFSFVQLVLLSLRSLGVAGEVVVASEYGVEKEEEDMRGEARGGVIVMRDLVAEETEWLRYPP